MQFSSEIDVYHKVQVLVVHCNQHGLGRTCYHCIATGFLFDT